MQTTQQPKKAREDGADITMEPVKKKTKKPRCFNCNKKVGLTAIQCKCSNVYCNKCRYPREHNCSYDYKKEQVSKLNKELPKCQFKKMETL